MVPCVTGEKQQERMETGKTSKRQDNVSEPTMTKNLWYKLMRTRPGG